MGGPNQGETFCQDSEAECPHCGVAMALDSEPVERGGGFSCSHCNGKIVVSEVDYTIYVRLKVKA